MTKKIALSFNETVPASVEPRSAAVEAFAAGDDLRDIVEVAGADFVLMFGRGVAIDFGGELRFLQFRIGRHAAIAIAARQIEHAVVERVEIRPG